MKVKIEKIVFGGAGLGRLEDPEKPNGLGASGRVVFVWNALPGEEVEFELIKKEKTHWEGVATKILNPSPARLEPKEAHYLSCSPWQIMTPEEENKWKIEMAKETYQKIGGFDCELELAGNDVDWGYRNKMEYSFAETVNHLTPDPSPCKGEGNIMLSFFERGKKVRQCIEACELANPEINRVAKVILSWINKNKIPMRSLKAMILRSNLKNEVIAALFIKDKLEFKDFPKLDKNFVGFKLYYSTHKSPASVPTALLHAEGQDYLTEKILGTKLKYGIFSFFQINIPVFEMALKDIGQHICNPCNLCPKSVVNSVVDFYSGVGSISLPLYNMYKGAVLVDNCAEAIEFARENIDAVGKPPHPRTPLLGKERGELVAECMPAEKMTELITSDKIIIVDPPRAGLHEDVVKRILAQKPARVIYLSCNLSTQARDIKLLSEGYGVVFTKLYNFFPRTPHVEGLVVLEITK